jgi:hypothetical protein
VGNNSRFPVLTGRERFPNLALRILGLRWRRLSDDWQQRWNHPVWAVADTTAGPAVK